MLSAIFSIKPCFVEKILAGKKCYEYRKRKCKQKIDRILLYSTLPVSSIVGEVLVENILEEQPCFLWNATHVFSGLTEQEFYNYFNGCNKAFAYQLFNPVKYSNYIKLSDLGLYVPQSFCYVSEDKYIESICEKLKNF